MTILAVAQQAGIWIPTLCFLKDRSAVGSCRVCVVEVEGEEHPLPACKTAAREGMVVTTTSERLTTYRRIALDLMVSGLSGEALQLFAAQAGPTKEQDINQLQRLCREYGVKEPSYQRNTVKEPVVESNPFLSYDPNLCIRCQRCVGACNTAARNHTLRTGKRGRRTTIEAPFGADWRASACESCGNCAQACPTGALVGKPQQHYRLSETRRVRTTCPYCGVGCQLDLLVKNGAVVGTEGAPGPSNKGLLCVKGRFASYGFVDAPDRIRTPLIKNAQTGEFEPATWDEALTLVSTRFAQIKAEHGGEALAAFACSRATNEDIYMFQKMARTVMETNNVDCCARV
jgi:predicted molibdopterin-dependent oxidoreductase YjgC